MKVYPDGRIENSKPSVLFWLIIIAISLVLGLILGLALGRDWERRQAIESGFAHYERGPSPAGKFTYGPTP